MDQLRATSTGNLLYCYHCSTPLFDSNIETRTWSHHGVPCTRVACIDCRTMSPWPIGAWYPADAGIDDTRPAERAAIAAFISTAQRWEMYGWRDHVVGTGYSKGTHVPVRCRSVQERLAACRLAEVSFAELASGHCGQSSRDRWANGADDNNDVSVRGDV